MKYNWKKVNMNASPLQSRISCLFSYLEKVQQATTNNSQVSSLQGLGMVHSRKLKQQQVENSTFSQK